MNTLNHLAIIMDGNGRWAKLNKLPRTAGHYKGVEVLRNITIYANRLGIKCLTVYAFSTENWKRSMEEVSYIMSLPKIFFASYIKELMDNNVRIMIIGDRERIPAETMKVIDDAIETTKNNTGLILNFAFNYGARDEIVRAAGKVISCNKNRIPKKVRAVRSGGSVSCQGSGPPRTPGAALSMQGLCEHSFALLPFLILTFFSPPRSFFQGTLGRESGLLI